MKFSSLRHGTLKKAPLWKGNMVRAKQSDIGENHSTLYSLQQADGNVVKVWGSTVLDGKMANVGIDQYVQIKFLGSKPSPNRKGKTYKDWAVFIADE